MRGFDAQAVAATRGQEGVLSSPRSLNKLVIKIEEEKTSTPDITAQAE